MRNLCSTSEVFSLGPFALFIQLEKWIADMFHLDLRPQRFALLRYVPMDGACAPCAGVGVALACILACFCPASMLSQSTQLGFSNSPPSFGHGNDYIQLLNETVNPADGSLTLKIGIPTPSGRGINLSYGLTYNSSVMRSFSQSDTMESYPVFIQPAWLAGNAGYATLGGWSDTLPRLVVEHTPYAEVRSTPPGDDLGTTLVLCESWQGFQFTDLSGQTHQPILKLGNLYSEGNGCTMPLPGAQDTAYDGILQGHASLAGAAEFATNDGTYYQFALSSDSSGGAVMLYPQLIEDKNGNKMSIVNSSDNSNVLIGFGPIAPTGTSVIDTLGRSVVNLQSGSQNHVLINVSGLPKPYSINFGSIPNFTGIHTPQSSLIVQGTGDQVLQTGSTMDTINAFPAGVNGGGGITSLTLPDGGSYGFSYESMFGNISKITYPNGGYVSYTWGFPGGFSDDANYTGRYIFDAQETWEDFRVYVQYAMPVILHREVSVDGSTVAQTQDFSYQTTFRSGDMMSGWATKTTTVTTNDLVAGTTSSMTYSYSPSSTHGYDPSQRYTGQTAQEYQAVYKDGAGNVLQTTCKTWGGDFLSTQKTILANGMVSEHDFDYTATGVSGAPTGGDDYDFSAPQSNPSCLSPYSPNFLSGSPAPGPLMRSIRQTSNVTATSPISLYPYAPSIVNIPSSTIVKNGTGAIVAETDYQYTDATQSVNGVVQHDPAFENNIPQVRQNLLSATKTCSLSCTAMTTTYGYDDTGQVVSTTDGKGNPTTYSYADAYASSTGQPSSLTNAYLTKIMRPSTNGVSHIQQFTYGFNDGKMRTATGENSKVTTYCYMTGGCSGTAYDPWTRLTQIQYPDGGSETATYNDAGSSPTVVTSTAMTSSVNMVQTVIGDGMGRTIQTQTSDPSGTDYVDTRYNGLGQVYSVSNPYRSTSDSTYGLTTYTYDGLGRKILQIQPDGSMFQWCYNGIVSNSAQSVCSANGSSFPNASWVDTADETGHHWQQVNDGLGRLLAAMEPDPVTNQLSLETDYTYSALSNLTSVTQKGTSTEIPRIRSFSYDSLSRLITSANPETGTICYGQWSGGNCTNGYDANGNLLYKTDARGITTSYSYDVLNRLHRKDYSDGTAVAFGYDGNDWAGNLLPQNYTATSNVIGRLTYATNGVNADYGYGYDAMGRVITQSYCLPDNCGNRQYVNAGYDLAGHMTSLTYPDGRTINQTFDPAGRLTVSNLVGIGGISVSQSYLQSAIYNPDGSPNVLTLGNGVQQTVTENNRLQVQAISVGTPLAPFDGQNFLSHTYCYTNCTAPGGFQTGPGPIGGCFGGCSSPPPSSSVGDNGNILQINDNLNTSRTQSFTYDNLNRITSFSLGGVANQQYQIDSFGDMTGMNGSTPISTFDPNTNRINNLPCASIFPSSISNQYPQWPYDNAGNQLCDINSAGAPRIYSYDAESRITQIALASAPSSPFVTYSYEADGSRVSKNNANGTYTEYVEFGGQPIAEKDQNGNWTDYVYANGRKIARVTQQYPRLHLQATGCGANTEQDWNYQVGAIPVGVGDRMVWREKHLNSQPSYLKVQFSNNVWIFDGATADENGAWQTASVDLSQWAGDTLWATWIAEIADGNGAINAEIKDLNFVKSDGTIYQALSTASSFGCSASSTVTENATDDVAANPAEATHFYLDDHLGTAQLEFASGGWPVWQGQFAPFGGELDTQSTANNYKFTGKERDTESGLDYFGARYNSSNMGRFMSPDPSMDSVALRNPQTWNRYSYTLNNPLKYIDPTGMCWVAAPSGVGTYDWMNSPNPGQTCLNAVATSNGNTLTMYGSSNAQDITKLTGNDHGMIDLQDMSAQHDAGIDVKQGNYTYVNVQTGADFFNFLQDYQSNYPNAPNLVVTEAGSSDGSLVPGHLSHRDGKQIDLRYVDANGNPIQGAKASDSADSDRMWDIFRGAHASGLTQIYLGDETKWGDFGHTPAAPADPHTSHFHLSIPNPRPPSK